MTLRNAFPVVGLCLLAITPAFAAEEASPNTIRVDGSLEAATEILRAHRIEYVEGGLSTTNPNPDASFLLCLFDKEHTSVVLHYSKSKSTITGISVIMFPAQKHTRVDEVWSEAQSVTPAANGKYSIEFLPHNPPALRPSAKNVYP